MNEIAYVGSELDLFARAVNWKRYWSSILRPCLGTRILDVGAGIGATLDVLADGPGRRWLALEPDPGLAERLRARVAAGEIRAEVEVRTGTIADLAPDERFDTILYIDVLEHIAEDAAEFSRAAERLLPGGRVCVLSPAHQWLFTPFDAAIGHERRYTRASLAAAAPPGLVCERLDYLDSVGMLASMGNRFLLRSAHPRESQIALWDRVMVPASRVLDPVLLRRVGKSVLGVWRREGGP
jgi:SAM-dependent methyltransferase